MRLYDDDVKLFLTHCFRSIDYLRDTPQEILVNLAYLCNAEIKEKGSMLFNMDEDPDEQIVDEMIIVFDGSIELFLHMDAGTEFSLEILPTGSIINAHNFLSQRKHSINARMNTNTTFYYLKYAKIVEVAKMYPRFAKDLLREKGKSEALKSRDQNPVDYILGSKLYTDPNFKQHSPEVSDRMLEILFALKNSVVYYLLKNRKDRKVKNLKKILEEFISKKNKQKEMQRIKKRELE